MKIAIRMDDITSGMDMDLFRRFKALLDKAGIKPLIGVIPDCKDPKLMRGGSDDEAFWQNVRELSDKGWVIAMHGLTHVYSTKNGGLLPLNDQSEFAGLSFEEQLRMLAGGREILASHGIETDIFMAPSHSYDMNTLRALKQTGFKYVTDGFGRFPYEREGLVFLPISVSRKNTLRDMKEGFSTFVVHTDTMNDRDFGYYEKLFAKERDRFISYDELISAPQVKRNISGNTWEYMMASAKKIMVKLRA